MSACIPPEMYEMSEVCHEKLQKRASRNIKWALGGLQFLQFDTRSLFEFKTVL